MWGTDLTTTVLRDGTNVSVMIAVDHCTMECVGIHAAKPAKAFEALEPIRQGLREHFGDVAADIARGLAVRHDNGPQYVSDTFQNELRFFGIESSPSFVRAPEGNGCSERFIRILKEQLLWVRYFDSIEELRLALHEWRRVYNEQWLLERHGFLSPTAARAALAQRAVA
jgi:putative transposase